MAVVLKQLREKAGFIQSDVYAETGIHVGRIETAKANVSVSTLAELCKFYDISLSDFFKKVETLAARKISSH